MEVPGKRADEKNDSSSWQTEKLCEPCSTEHAKTPANGVCQECKEFMCNTCFRHHLKAKQCRNHVLVDENISKALLRKNEITEKCKRHEDETVKYYCRKHEFVGCGDCMILGHNVCKPEFIKDLSKDFQDNKDFKELVRKLENLTSANQENEKTIKENRREIRLMYETALKGITKFRTEINLFLDKAEDDVKSEVNRLKSDDEDLLTKLEEECKLLSTKIDAVKQAINTELYQGQSLFIRSVESKSDIFDTERAIAQLQSRYSIKKFKFVREKKLSSIVASKIKFGDLDISHNGQVIKKAKDSELMSYARVYPYDNCKRGKSDYHRWKPGTVIAVDINGDVTVEWDHSGNILGGFRFGYSDYDNGVKLI